MRKDNKDLLTRPTCRPGPRRSTPASSSRTVGSAALVINKKSQVIDESMQIAKMILSPERYPTQLEKAGSYWFPIMKNYVNIPFFTQDEWNKEVVGEYRAECDPAANADTGLNPIFDDITISATKDMMQAVVVNGKSPQEAIKILADAADKAKEKFKK